MNTTNPYVTPESEFIESDITEYSDVKFFGFSGRIGRIRYLAYLTISYFIVLLAVGIFAGVMGGMSAAVGGESPAAGALGGVFVLLAGVLYIGMFVLFLSFLIRRLHDIDWSGWACLLMFIPIVNMIMGLVIVFMPGTKGANRFGNQTPPNSILMTVIGLIMPIIMVVGILAAVALPAYKDYTVRAQQHQQQALDD